jgi:hypothetical protein
MMVDTFIPPYQLTPTMDIFAAGYVVPFIVQLLPLHRRFYFTFINIKYLRFFNQMFAD